MEMNPCIILTHNCCELTKRCVQSVKEQSLQVSVLIHDNGSTDGTLDWLRQDQYVSYKATENIGVSAGWNRELEFFFDELDHEHCLVLNNDVVLAPWFYRELLSYDAPFVSGFSVGTMDEMKELPGRVPLAGGPDFSAFLIRRSAWRKIGPFDEKMKFYAQDCDYHIRAAREGVPLLTAHLPFYHERSSTLRLASPEEAEQIHAQANRDREAFKKKWGFEVGSEQYARAVGSLAGSAVPFPGEICESL